MGSVYGLAQRKGGVGKTSSTATLAVEFARQSIGQTPGATTLDAGRVLAVEMDTQRDLSKGLGIDLETWRYERQQRLQRGGAQEEELFSIYEVLLNPEYGVNYATYATPWGVDVLPSVAAMSGIERDLANAVARESRLQTALRNAGTDDYPVAVQAIDKWHAIFVDSPPSLSILTLNVLAAVDYVLIPVEIGEYALDAIPEVLQAVELVRRINRKIKVGGIFCTKYDPRNKLSSNIVNEVRTRYGRQVFETVIPLNTRMAETPSIRKPIQAYDAASSSAIAYAQLAQEIRQRCP